MREEGGGGGGGREREHEAQSTNGLFKGHKAHNVHATRSTQRKRKCERVGAWECCVVGACARFERFRILVLWESNCWFVSRRGMWGAP